MLKPGLELRFCSRARRGPCSAAAAAIDAATSAAAATRADAAASTFCMAAGAAQILRSKCRAAWCESGRLHRGAVHESSHSMLAALRKRCTESSRTAALLTQVAAVRSQGALPVVRTSDACSLSKAEAVPMLSHLVSDGFSLYLSPSQACQAPACCAITEPKMCTHPPSWTR